MNIEIDRHPRDSNERVALCIYARSGPPDHLQFKIDIWSEKKTNQLYMRLDGLGYLHLQSFQSLVEIFVCLQEMEDKGPSLVAAFREKTNLPEKYWRSDEIITEYFEGARKAALAELEPLLGFSCN